MHDAAFRQLVCRRPQNVLAVKAHMPLPHGRPVGSCKPRYCLEYRALAGTIGAEQGNDLSLADGQRNIRDRQDCAAIDDLYARHVQKTTVGSDRQFRLKGHFSLLVGPGRLPPRS